MRVDFGGVILKISDGGNAGSHRERIAAERSRLVDGAERGEHVHESTLAAEDADGESAADDFAEGYEIGVDVVTLERTTERDTEAGHDFIDDEQGSFALCKGAKTGEIAGGR